MFYVLKWIFQKKKTHTHTHIHTHFSERRSSLFGLYRNILLLPERVGSFNTLKPGDLDHLLLFTYIIGNINNCQSGCVNLHPHHQGKRIPFYPHPFQVVLFVDFFDDGYSDRCEVVWFYPVNPLYSLDLHLHCSLDLCFSTNETIEHLFMCLLAICVSSLVKCLFRSSAYFLICLLVFLV